MSRASASRSRRCGRAWALILVSAPAIGQYFTPEQLAGSEVRGTVRAVSGDRIRVDMGALEWLPIPVAPGTDIAIGFEVPGVGLVAVEARFRLTQVDDSSFELRAVPPEAAAAIRPGYPVLLPPPGQFMSQLQRRSEYRARRAEALRFVTEATGEVAAAIRNVGLLGLQDIGDYDACLAHSPRVIDDPAAPAELRGGALSRRSRIREVRGDGRGAVADLKSAVAIPGREGVGLLLDHESLCRLAVDSGDPAAARETCGQCLRIAAGRSTTCGRRLEEFGAAALP